MTDEEMIATPKKTRSTRVAPEAPAKIYPPAPLVYCGVPVGRHGILVSALGSKEIERLKAAGWTTSPAPKGIDP